MKQTFFLLLSVLLLAGCKKEHGSRVDIYMLKSFTAGIDQTVTPAVNTIINATLDDIPLVADEDIILYNRESSIFTLKKDIKAIIQNFGPDKAFAVTVDKQVVYYGVFHPAYMSSMVFGLATIDPILISSKELRVDFVNLTGTFVHQLDKRNDDRIINTMKATRRLR